MGILDHSDREIVDDRYAESVERAVTKAVSASTMAATEMGVAIDAEMPYSRAILDLLHTRAEMLRCLDGFAYHGEDPTTDVGFVHFVDTLHDTGIEED